MNQQQKKFAVTRIFNILCKKLSDIQQEDKRKIEDVPTENDMTLQQVATAIRKNVINLKANKDISNSDTISRQTYLRDLFDMSPIKESRDAYILKHNMPINSWGSPSTSSISLDNPLNSDRFLVSICTYECKTRVAAVQAAMLSSADSIILGSDAEAIAAITSIEAMEF